MLSKSREADMSAAPMEVSREESHSGGGEEAEEKEVVNRQGLVMRRSLLNGLIVSFGKKGKDILGEKDADDVLCEYARASRDAAVYVRGTDGRPQLAPEATLDWPRSKNEIVRFSATSGF